MSAAISEQDWIKWQNEITRLLTCTKPHRALARHARFVRDNPGRWRLPAVAAFLATRCRAARTKRNWPKLLDAYEHAIAEVTS